MIKTTLLKRFPSERELNRFLILNDLYVDYVNSYPVDSEIMLVFSTENPSIAKNC